MDTFVKLGVPGLLIGLGFVLLCIGLFGKGISFVKKTIAVKGVIRTPARILSGFFGVALTATGVAVFNYLSMV